MGLSPFARERVALSLPSLRRPRTARASLQIERADRLERSELFGSAAKPSRDGSPHAMHELRAHRRSRKTPQEGSHCRTMARKPWSSAGTLCPRDRRRDGWHNCPPRSETRPTRPVSDRPSRFPWPSRRACPRLAERAWLGRLHSKRARAVKRPPVLSSEPLPDWSWSGVCCPVVNDLVAIPPAAKWRQTQLE